MKKNNILILILVLSIQSFAQEHAWVYFNDKQDVAAFYANPLSVMTQRSLDRRTRQGITLDDTDAPITQIYVDQVENATGITVKATSKWLNAVHILGSESNINALSTLSFIDHIEFAATNLNTRNQNLKPIDKFNFQDETHKIIYNYGDSYNQTQQISVDYLHENDYTGAGMMIAVMDNGFPGVDFLDTFNYIRDNEQILGGYNFIERNTNIYARGSHGLSVLSTIAGKKDGQLVGTAIDATFYLFITEDNQSETPLEESYWVEAAERADEYGVDIINTSLGYSTFDDSRYNYTYADMDGDTTFITRGANIAASKGILVCNSAGNSGNNSWHYITAPADGDNVFTVGAVDGNGNIAGFSSYGPTSDGQIKPDVLAKGLNTTIVNSSGSITTANGTSFSSPIMAGAIASFWQAYPNKTNFEIMQAIRESAHLYNNPTDQEGFGIPNLENAFNAVANVNDNELASLTLYPNPSKDKIHLNGINDENTRNIQIFNTLGELILSKKMNTTSFSVKDLNDGVYLVVLNFDNLNTKTFKIIKN
ncbi:MAG: S8 family serine peptidase [Flavobacteriaceae bacterium]|nr:S8 family serine peptidase [Flavobacteriaceae bacterium]